MFIIIPVNKTAIISLYIVFSAIYFQKFRICVLLRRAMDKLHTISVSSLTQKPPVEVSLDS